MRKVIGIGETILDIIFRNEQPSAADFVFLRSCRVLYPLVIFDCPGQVDGIAGDIEYRVGQDIVGYRQACRMNELAFIFGID